jgi:hypothetical protein
VLFAIANAQSQLTATITSGLTELGQAVVVEGFYQAVGALDDQLVSVAWGDGSVSEIPGNPAKSFTSSKAYAAPGIYSVTAKITDAYGRTAVQSLGNVIVVSRNVGPISGGGIVATSSGKITFSLQAGYNQSGGLDAAVRLQFHSGARGTFISHNAQWYVRAGNYAYLAGAGEYNGIAGCKFMLTASDANATTSPDRLRIQVWNPHGEVIFDNEPGVLFPSKLNSDATNLEAGNLSFHRVK